MRGKHNRASLFAVPFYHSREWKACRAAVMAERGGLCEDCKERGDITPATEVHHMIELTPDNISDPEVSLNPEHLRCLCHRCHDARHGRRTEKRYEVMPDGSIVC